MPVRKRTDKRAAGIDAWREYLRHGFDILNTIYAAGLPVPPPREMALAAWLRHRDQLRIEWAADERDRRFPVWAEAEFENAD